MCYIKEKAGRVVFRIEQDSHFYLFLKHEQCELQFTVQCIKNSIIYSIVYSIL